MRKVFCALESILILLVFILLLLFSCAPSSPPAFSISPLELEPLAPHTSELFTISFTITNSGGRQGEYQAVLYIVRMISLTEEDPASEKSFSQTVSVLAGQSCLVEFKSLSLGDGLYKASIEKELKYFEVGC